MRGHKADSVFIDEWREVFTSERVMPAAGERPYVEQQAEEDRARLSSQDVRKPEDR